MQGPATTLPVRGIAQNCLILIFAIAVALAMAMPSVNPATNRSDGFNKSSIASSSRSAFALPTASLSPLLIFAFSSHRAAHKRT
jgi:hypothetical protein